MSVHNWSGWPGAFCLICGCGCVQEDALGCDKCKWSGGPYGIDDVVYCKDHQTMADVTKECKKTNNMNS